MIAWSFYRDVIVLFSPVVVGWLGSLLRNWLAAIPLVSARTSSGMVLPCKIDPKLIRKSTLLASAELNLSARERADMGHRIRRDFRLG